MEHMRDDDVVILSIVNRETYTHDNSRRIKKAKGEELIRKADDIYYQNNIFFGTLCLYGILRDKDVVHSILFPQLE